MAISDSKSPRNIAIKLHRQFGHPSSEKLIKLIRKAGIKDKFLEQEIINISQNCLYCLQYKRAQPRPIVSISLAKTFNETLSMDLKFWGKYTFLVIVDNATRFCTATVINNRLPSTIIKGFFVSWIAIFGAPSKIITDNGGEFNNNEMRALGESFNIKVLSTAAESPWSNGIVERLNAVLGNMVSKISEDANCDVHTALAWAVSARNAFDNNGGFSPNQLVFGFNPTIPNVFNNKLPALEEVTSSEIVRKNLNAKQAAREAFAECEASEKLSRALRNNIRNTEIDDLRSGDDVFYKRNDGPRWHGPGQVIGFDGKQVLVKHGGTFVRVHTTRLAKLPEKRKLEADEVEGPDTISSHCKKLRTDSDLQNSQIGVGQEVQMRSEVPSGSSEAQMRSEVPSGSSEEQIGSEVPCESSEEQIGSEVPCESSEEQIGSEVPCEISEGQTVSEAPCGTKHTSNEKHHKAFNNAGPSKHSRMPGIWRSGQRFKATDTNTGQHISGKIINRAGKVKGINKDCYNIVRDSDGRQVWVDFKTLTDLSPVDDEIEMIVLFNNDAVSVAKEKEIKSWKDNEVYEEVVDVGQRAITVRWVITERFKGGLILTKARLVARGFEEITSHLRKDSPTCSKESTRMLFIFAAANGWKCNTVDVKSAYLQGDPIDRDIFLIPPPEFENGCLWKLKKTVYGLADAARAWYNRVKTELINLTVEMCTLDDSLFFWKHEGKLQGVICIYVDDFLWTGTSLFNKKIIQVLKTKFLIGNSESISFTYIGLQIESYKDGITVDQNKYASSLSRIPLSPARESERESNLLEAEKRPYRALVGQLNWMATQTRPDIAFDTCELGGCFSKATISDLQKLNSLVDKAKGNPLSLHFPPLKSLENSTIVCYTDAGHANLPNGGSQGACIIFLKDEDGKKCPIYWQTRKLKRVVKSTLAAETMALLEGAEASVYIKNIMTQLLGQNNIKIQCMTDNYSLYMALQSSKQVEDKRLRIDIAVLKDMLARTELEKVSWVSGKEQLADALTKKGVGNDKLRAALSRHT